MCKNINIKHYEVRIPCATKELAKKVVEALVFSGFNVYISYDTFHKQNDVWEVCYEAQVDEITAVEEK